MSTGPEVPDELAARRRSGGHHRAGEPATPAGVDATPVVGGPADPGTSSAGPVPGAADPSAAERRAGVAAGHRLQLAEVLADFTQDLLTDFNVDLVLAHLCDRLPAVLPVDGAGVSLLEEGQLRFAQASDPELAEAERLQARLGEGPCFDVIAGREPVQVPDLRRETRWRRYGPAALAAGVSAVTAVPMTARGRTWGVVDLYSRTPLRLDAEDLAAARLLAKVATNYVLHARDRQDRQSAEDALRVQTLHDPLTGLPNRSLLLDRLTQSLATAARDGHTLAVLFLDLDRFKQVNDTYGHAAGDRLLLGVSQALQPALRPGDTLARLAGDEFVVLAVDQHPTRRPLGSATLLARRLLRALEQPIRVNGHSVRISASVGIAYAEAGDTPESLLHGADTAMYEAKARADEHIAVSDRRTATTVPSVLQLEAELATALDEGQLRLHYQPVVDLRTGGLAGAEALVRWQHPHRGLLAPESFLPAAEVTGQINDLGHWVTATACRSLRAADDRLPGGFHLALNASPRELHHPDFLPFLRRCVQESAVDPTRLCVEVTEVSLIADLAETAAVLEQIRDLGGKVAVDDFGTGFSSLTYLHRLPVDVLKIDRSFVQTLTTTTAGEVIVAHVIGLAHGLGLSVTAEGIETPEQRQRLQALGCDHGQGYALGRPQPQMLPARDAP